MQAIGPKQTNEIQGLQQSNKYMRKTFLQKQQIKH